MITGKQLNSQLKILAFWNVMIATETNRIFKELVEHGYAEATSEAEPGKWHFHITDYGKQKAAQLCPPSR